MQVPVPLRPLVEGRVRLVEEDVLHGAAEVLAEGLPEWLVAGLHELAGSFGHQEVRYPGRRGPGRDEHGDETVVQARRCWSRHPDRAAVLVAGRDADRGGHVADLVKIGDLAVRVSDRGDYLPVRPGNPA